MCSFASFGLSCQICYKGLTPEQCAEDIHGNKWDVCTGVCAQQAGIIEEDRWENEGGKPT